MKNTIKSIPAINALMLVTFTERQVMDLKRILKAVIAAVLCAIMLTACGKTKEQKLIVGTWKYDNPSLSITYTFNDDMTCTVVTKAKDFKIEGKKEGTYTFNKGMLTVYVNGKIDTVAAPRFRDDNNMVWGELIEEVVYVRQ